jgi:thioredoxin reductase (NADPH)
MTTEIENFPGYPEGVQGSEMMDDLRKQAIRFGTDVRDGSIVKADLSQRPFTLTDENGNIIKADTVIIATGASARWLGLESEKRLLGNGVSACATCDGFFYRGQDVAVVGGGDTACEDASYLANLCNKVYLIVRRDELRASKSMQHRVKENPKIEILWNSVPQEVLGNDMDGVTGISLKNVKTGEDKEIAISGFFVAIGNKPNAELFAGQIDMDENGYIKVADPTSQTNIEGVFAAGDVCSPMYRQAIVAAGKGCIAAIDVERFLSEHK